jgi:hypothetical protein
MIYPDWLYRFRSDDTPYFWEELANVINHSRFFLPTSNALNDPFEFRPTHQPSSIPDTLSALKARFGSRPIISRDRASQLQGRTLARGEYRRGIGRHKPNFKTAQFEIKTAKGTFAELPKHARLACFSENLQSVPMWGHYSNNHKGICLQFALEINDQTRIEEVLPLPVEYSDCRPVVTTIDLMNFTRRGSDDEQVDGIADKVFGALYLTKPKDWEYEREWRIFISSEAAPKYHHAPMLKPVALYFGVRADPETISRTVSEFGTKVDIYSSEISPDRFGFEFSKRN